MPSSLAPKPSTRSKPLARLLVLTLVVGLAHAALLGGVPSNLGLGGGSTVLQTGSFATRMIAPEPQPAPVQDAATPVAPRPRVTKPVAKPQAVVGDSDTASTGSTPPDSSPASAAAGNAAEPLAPAAVAETSTVADKPASDSASMDGVQMAAASKTTEPAKPAAPTAPPPPSTPVQLPPSTRLLYDGKGEEKGFIKYAANAELLWQQDSSSYNAKLEITYLGFRLRTWTSKGTLDDGGLEPTRFGDKPRGAELATHFQRDKGIISFSANNPDVPLQAGAQDRLSAMLQLTALMAGAPDRFALGSSISFQAADAHAVEPWTFKVGALEQLDLPGGPIKAIKLTKVTSAEYSQGLEVWLAPELHYLPVHIRITESSGAVVDLLWRKTEKAD